MTDNARVIFEMAKHLTTLSSGAVVMLATFVPRTTGALGTNSVSALKHAMCSLIAAIIFGMVSMLSSASLTNDANRTRMGLVVAGYVVAMAAFVIGMYELSAFLTATLALPKS